MQSLDRVKRREQPIMPPSLKNFMKNPVAIVKQCINALDDTHPIDRAIDIVLSDAVAFGYFTINEHPDGSVKVVPRSDTVNAYKQIQRIRSTLFYKESSALFKTLEKANGISPKAATDLATLAIQAHKESVKGMNKHFETNSPTRQHTAFCKKVIKLRNQHLTNR
jgi:hypothetical protein